jgi:hypothetical protein
VSFVTTLVLQRVASVVPLGSRISGELGHIRADAKDQLTARSKLARINVAETFFRHPEFPKHKDLLKLGIKVVRPAKVNYLCRGTGGVTCGGGDQKGSTRQGCPTVNMDTNATRRHSPRSSSYRTTPIFLWERCASQTCTYSTIHRNERQSVLPNVVAMRMAECHLRGRAAGGCWMNVEGAGRTQSGRDSVV